MFRWWIRLEVIEVADRYRITITRSVREVVPLRVGQKVAVVPFGDKIIVEQSETQNNYKLFPKMKKGDQEFDM